MNSRGVTVAVGAVIEDEAGRVLLVKHLPQKGGFWQGKWICPGGKLKRGEGMEEALRREIMEETRLKVAIIRPLVPFERIVKSNGRTILHVIYIDFLARPSGGELRPGSDVGEAKWVAKSELPLLWEELHEDTRKLLKLAGVV